MTARHGRGSAAGNLSWLPRSFALRVTSWSLQAEPAFTFKARAAVPIYSNRNALFAGVGTAPAVGGGGGGQPRPPSQYDNPYNYDILVLEMAGVPAPSTAQTASSLSLVSIADAGLVHWKPTSLRRHLQPVSYAVPPIDLLSAYAVLALPRLSSAPPVPRSPLPLHKTYASALRLLR